MSAALDDYQFKRTKDPFVEVGSEQIAVRFGRKLLRKCISNVSWRETPLGWKSWRIDRPAIDTLLT